MKIYDKIVFNLATYRYHLDNLTIKVEDYWSNRPQWLNENDIEQYYSTKLQFYIGENNEFDYQKNKIHYEINEITEPNEPQNVISAKIYQFENVDKFIEFLTDEHNYELIIRHTKHILSRFDINNIADYNGYILCSIGKEKLIIEKDIFVSFVNQCFQLINFLRDNKLILFRNEENVFRCLLKIYSFDEMKPYNGLPLTQFYNTNNKDILDFDDKYDMLDKIVVLCPNFVYDYGYKIET